MARAVLAAGALVLAVAAPAPAQVIMKEVPEQARGLELRNRIGQTLPLDLVFKNARGTDVRLRDLLGDGRPLVVQMMYFRCPILCPKLRQETVQALSGTGLAPGTDYHAVFVSFDERDGPLDAEREKNEALIEWADPPKRTVSQAVRNGFHVLTGTAADARALADALGFPYRYLPESGEFAHGTVIYVVTPQGKLSRAINTTQGDDHGWFVPRDLRLALVEAGQGKVGTVFDSFTLWCYHYDPAAGAYVLQAVRVMQAGGALTLLALAGLIGGLLVRERRRRGLGVEGGGGVLAVPRVTRTS
ncbi:MAG TPA: SCO family protein [Phycisphaerales bacterium]|nr:SCO family protein [Phycisphaerales bacterium]